MRRLFVDVDDTLVTWLGGREPHPYGLGAERWEPNVRVQRFVHEWRAAHPDGVVVVWSGGGGDYAKTWADRLLPGAYDVAAAKGTIPRTDPHEDTFLDDAPFESWRGTILHPPDLTVGEDVGMVPVEVSQ